MPATYAQSGVDIAEGEKLVQHIRRSVKSTYSKAVLGDIGLFGAFYDARFKSYESPVLVSSVDGVGTKLLIAQMMDIHDTVGQDLVNHCVNDILVCGAKPLFFMDYFATGKLESKTATKVISGFVKACKENRCSLIGGETAEMPGIYGTKVYDLSGTIVGVVERKRMITGKGIKAGDVLLGLPSTGLHTNGYSLARKVLLSKYMLNDYVSEIGGILGQVLLNVHRSYLDIVSSITKKFEVKGLSHITGGGIIGNTMRVIPKGLSIQVSWKAWERPPVFNLIQRVGKVPERDMRHTFNLGVGLVIIASREESERIRGFARKKGEQCIDVGEVVRHVC